MASVVIGTGGIVRNLEGDSKCMPLKCAITS